MADWDARFIRLAGHISGWSKDPSSKVGAVLVNDKRQVVGLGYNGFPRNTSDDSGHYNDRATKYLRVVHAEVNAVLNATGSTEGATAYVTHPCCSQCMALLIQSGIKRVVYKENPNLFERMGDSLTMALHMADEAGVEVRVFTWA
jgi:dCMP deaminase